jgi:hypothetical protein
MASIVGSFVRRLSPWLLGALLFAAVAFGAYRACGSKELPLPRIMQIAESSTARTLQVPVLHYTRDGEPTVVDFISAVHIGEKSYYEQLNQLFTKYDVVLFEMIADESVEEKLRSHEKKDSSLGSFQRKMAEFCGLSFQLDEIDYSAPNFVHADLSPDALRDAMTMRGESPLQLIGKILKLSFDPKFAKTIQESGFNNAGLDGVNPLLVMLRGPTDRERGKIKKFMAQGMTASETVLSALEGERGISLIDDRNARIVTVLREQLAAKRGRIAIFYGAGHAPDLHARFNNELGFKLTKIEWLNAWDLGPDAK